MNCSAREGALRDSRLQPVQERAAGCSEGRGSDKIRDIAKLTAGSRSCRIWRAVSNVCGRLWRKPETQRYAALCVN